MRPARRPLVEEALLQRPWDGIRRGPRGPVEGVQPRTRTLMRSVPGIVQGEMPPLFIVGPDGKPEIVNYRTHGNVLIVDRLFAAAELRLGGENQQKVRIVRTDGRS